jgi:hypothetical protein
MRGGGFWVRVVVVVVVGKGEWDGETRCVLVCWCVRIESLVDNKSTWEIIV